MPTATIIGAGPAGSLAALLLARAGWDISLIEQHHFPRDKVCGECLSSTGIDVLHRARVANVSIQPIELTRTLIHSPNGSCAELPLPRPMWGLSRHALDAHLLDAAVAAGAQLHQPARCERVSYEDGRASVTIRDLPTNQVRVLIPDYVVIADGKPAAQPSGDFGIKTHFENVNGPRDAVELFGVRGSYGGLAPIEGNRWNAAFSVPAARLRAACGDVAKVFQELISENRTLARRMRGTTTAGPWLAAPLPRSPVAPTWPDGTILIGNSSAALEPIGGEGMGLALASAELAVTAMINANQAGVPVDLNRLRSAYRGLWKVRSHACRTVARAVSFGKLTDWVMPAVIGCDPLVDAVMALMGKSVS